jgi:Trk K+ transport system NAD-binding subunit/Kef-type K+ transport system membrane component KefB
MTTVLLTVAFLLVCLASSHIGKFATVIKLPLITGYLFSGAVVGPFILGWLTEEQALSLRVVDHTALAFIAFAAGNELYLKEVRSRMRSITWVTTGLVVSTFTLGLIAVLQIADHISFMQPLPSASRWAVAMMAAAILVARSPSSAIAIINEMRARGPYVKTALGVTVVMDAVVILVFSTAASISQSLVAGVAFDPWFILRVLLDLLMSLNIGYIAGKLLQVVVSAETDTRIKTALVLAIGLGAFWLSHGLRDFSHHHLSWPITPEPLLACMIAGFIVTNFSRFREQFAHALHDVAPYIYLVFFTLVGASLALNALVKLWPIALILFTVRLSGIGIGSAGGGLLARMKPQHVRLGWMAYVTQAGVGLGLAKDVAAEFPAFGSEFATMIIAIIVINQIVGPPLFKSAIKRTGESHLPAAATPDEIRDALILGIDDQSLALARQLTAHGWQVVLADTDASNVEHVEEVAEGSLEARKLEQVDAENLTPLMSGSLDAVVAMLGDDDLNYEACELGYEKFGVPRLIVRLNDLSYSDRFDKIGALVVEPASAMVNLLDQFVRVPQLATLLQHRDPHHEVVQLTVADPDIVGLPLRELRLPPNVRLLGITREGHPIVPHGNICLERNDEVTLVGEGKHLDEVVTKWGY